MNNINKEQALARLTSLENEAKELRKIIDAPVKITDRVKTFEDACEVLSLNSTNLLAGCTSKDEIAYRKLKVIIQSLNEGWKPDWKNSSEAKWFSYFEYSEKGFGFSGVFFDYWIANSLVGSRLCFKNRELAEYAAKQFRDIYNDFLNL